MRSGHGIFVGDDSFKLQLRLISGIIGAAIALQPRSVARRDTNLGDHELLAAATDEEFSNCSENVWVQNRFNFLHWMYYFGPCVRKSTCMQSTGQCEICSAAIGVSRRRAAHALSYSIACAGLKILELHDFPDHGLANRSN